MAAPDASGQENVEVTFGSSAQYNVRATKGQGPNTFQNSQEGYLHESSNVSYGEAPFVSINPPVISSSSKYVHPFMLERFTDTNDNPRLRIYSGLFYSSLNFVQTEISSDTYDYSSSSSNDKFVTFHKQRAIEGLNANIVHTPAGESFVSLKDDDGNDTVHSVYDFPVGQTYGKIYLTWELTAPSTQGGNLTLSNIKIHRSASDASDTKIGELLQKQADGGDGAGDNVSEFKRAGGAGGVTGVYYIKLGESFDPAADGTNSKTIDQIVHENVYWQPLIVGESG